MIILIKYVDDLDDKDINYIFEYHKPANNRSTLTTKNECFAMFEYDCFVCFISIIKKTLKIKRLKWNEDDKCLCNYFFILMVKITTSITLDIIRVLKNHINCRNSFLFLLESFLKKNWKFIKHLFSILLIFFSIFLRYV